MTAEEKSSDFTGWAIVDVMGKQRYVGYVHTENYGTAAMFRVDVPELPERELVLESPAYIDGTWTPKGAKVKRLAAPGHTKIIGCGSIYMISPCTEDAAMRAIEALDRSELKLIELPKNHKGLLRFEGTTYGFELPDDADAEAFEEATR